MTAKYVLTKDHDLIRTFLSAEDAIDFYLKHVCVDTIAENIKGCLITLEKDGIPIFMFSPYDVVSNKTCVHEEITYQIQEIGCVPPGFYVEKHINEEKQWLIVNIMKANGDVYQVLSYDLQNVVLMEQIDKDIKNAFPKESWDVVELVEKEE